MKASRKRDKVGSLDLNPRRVSVSLDLVAPCLAKLVPLWRNRAGSCKERKVEMQGNGLMIIANGPNRCQSRRERKIALQRDVDKLRKKLRKEESIHSALERAFTRPRGALPRLPPYLPSHTLELLAEVAVLEEEVVRLEEQVVKFRQGLYQEAIYSSSCKKSKQLGYDVHPVTGNSKTLEQPHFMKGSASTQWSSNMDQNMPSSNKFVYGKFAPNKMNSSISITETQQGKENPLRTNIGKNCKQSPVKREIKIAAATMGNRQVDAQPKCDALDLERTEKNSKSLSDEAILYQSSAPKEATLCESSGPNKLSEDILKCLMNIFSGMSSPGNTNELLETSPVSYCNPSLEETNSLDPYGICAEFGKRDIGPYKHLRAVEGSSKFSVQNWRLKCLLRELASADLSCLTHQQKIAFWINIYNSCMMNAFLEKGIPASPEIIIALMLKAVINVGGHLLNAMTIEHFILRLPYSLKHVCPKGSKSDDVTVRGLFGLEWPEPLVTFALSCGSWSSPAVRVYTAAQVDKELERAKRDYLQAAVGICTPNKLAIPKLLDWYLGDFAKDVESLMDWICLQLPDEMRTEGIKCLEVARRSPIPQPIQVLPYEFRFSGICCGH
ncbi:hypothetical protein OPV22_011244 [Ensete ventricosum]|uniref:DUF547 domain-containing protein n=1 Tax=Ensete ventricosum TaxID=4639 RepID=A0AAV8RHF4_ENSVE|nr:hypothetical protein OPV22_011244 [Ensete ventricosum]